MYTGDTQWDSPSAEALLMHYIGTLQEKPKWVLFSESLEHRTKHL
jgi:hypothetical protein